MDEKKSIDQRRRIIYLKDLECHIVKSWAVQAPKGRRKNEVCRIVKQMFLLKAKHSKSAVDNIKETS